MEGQYIGAPIKVDIADCDRFRYVQGGVSSGESQGPGEGLRKNNQF